MKTLKNVSYKVILKNEELERVVTAATILMINGSHYLVSATDEGFEIFDMQGEKIFIVKASDLPEEAITMQDLVDAVLNQEQEAA